MIQPSVPWNVHIIALFLKIIAKIVCTACSNTSYKIVPLTNLNKYLHNGSNLIKVTVNKSSEKLYKNTANCLLRTKRNHILRINTGFNFRKLRWNPPIFNVFIFSIFLSCWTYSATYHFPLEFPDIYFTSFSHFTFLLHVPMSHSWTNRCNIISCRRANYEYFRSEIFSSLLLTFLS